MISLKAILRIASRLLAAGLFLFGTAVWQVQGQINLSQLQRDFDNGLFEKVAEIVNKHAPRGREERRGIDAALIGAKSLIALERFDEARKLLDLALSIAEKAKGSNGNVIAKIYFGYSALERARREFRASIEFAKKARASAANDRLVSSEYHFSIGRTFYSMGHDISATIWFERVLALLESNSDLGLTLDVYRYKGLVSSARFDYSTAIESYETLIKLSDRSRFGHKHRQALYELAGILNANGQKKRGLELFRRALRLSTAAQNFYLAQVVLSSLLLNSLYEGDIASAERYQKQLEHTDAKEKFAYEIAHARAVIAAMRGNNAAAAQYFAELAKLKGNSEYVVPYWKSTIAERRKDWQQLVQQNTWLLKLAEESNFRDDLPSIYLGLGKAHLGLREVDKAAEFTNLAISMIEEARRPGDAAFSFGLLEVYHSAYRLLAELRSENPETSFEIADFLKGRVLKDRIDQSPLKAKSAIPFETKNRIDVTTARFVDGNTSVEEIERLEKSAIVYAAAAPSLKAVAEELNKIDDLAETAIISYLFTPGGLRAYVWRKNKPVRVVKLSITEPEIEALVTSMTKKIKDLVFFKRDGKEIYDHLLAPLNVDADHFIIIPDKSLWRVPFHSLSPDASSYLIEKTLISYAPSVATLHQLLKNRAPERKTIRIFANNMYRDRFLRHVDAEARNIAGIFLSQPVLNATSADFLRRTGEADILHFAMHAELDPEEPLSSFLAFRSSSDHGGRVTVEDLLNVRLKPGALVFLASCDTSNVLNGEGLVSIGWAMLGSGGTSVISAQWDANDRSTQIFSELFYKKYREGLSTAEAVQAASIDMIRNKSNGSHEPYYWAAFSLLGDPR